MNSTLSFSKDSWMNRLLAAVVFAGPALFFVACGSSSSNNGAPVYNYSCQYDAYGRPIGNCAYQNGYAGAAIGYYSESAYTQTMSFSNASIPNTSYTVSLKSEPRKEFYKRSMGVCDNAYISGGTAGCDAWMNGGMNLRIQFSDLNSTRPSIMFKAFPYTNAYGWYSYQLPSFDQLLLGWVGAPIFTTNSYYRNPLLIDPSGTAMSKTQYGYEIRFYPTNGSGAWANPQMMQIFLYATPGADYIPYAIAYVDPTTNTNQPFATGILRRCAEGSCTSGTPW